MIANITKERMNEWNITLLQIKNYNNNTEPVVPVSILSIDNKVFVMNLVSFY